MGVAHLQFLKKHHLSFLRFMDMIFPYVLIAQAAGRWGNFVNQEAFGQVVSEDYFAKWPSFLNFIKDNMFINGAYREPMFFYESIACLAGLGLILLYERTAKPKRGDLGFAYFLWYGAIRFWIEARRSDSLMFMGLKMAQIVSLIFIVFALVGMSGIFLNKEKKTKPVLLFDLDGTLLNTEPIIHASFLHTFEKFRPDYTLSEQELMDFMGPTLEESFGKYLPEEQVADAIEYYRVFNTEHHGEYVKPFDGVTECLTKWKEEGYVVAIVSSKYTDTVELGLQVCGMTGMFDLVLGRDKYEKAKPDKCGLIEACKILGVSQDQAIYFGDATSDVKAGKNAGMYTVAFVPNTKREAQLRASCPNEVVLDFRDIDEIIHRNIVFSHDER
ncbi:MAG: HAD-IA family hydrolase [Erysipelotrichaceae bacterium]|nr:HAD-IA family hydrolase [Erysipelotrichaceae bacterium]